MMQSAIPSDRTPPGADWPRYQLFGLTMASAFSFANRLAPGSGTPDLRFWCDDSPPAGVELDGREPIYAHPYRLDDGQSYALVYRTRDCHVLRYSGFADFYLWRDRIACHLHDPALAYLVEIRLLGDVLALWLELRGVLALHASAVVMGQRAVAFASWNKGGKTSLAASFMQAGLPMLTDDILAVEFTETQVIGRAGYPQMRMWPEEASYFLGRFEDLEIVHPMFNKRRIPVGPDGLGTFAPEPTPLARLYILERGEGAGSIEIIALEPRQAVRELLRHSFARELVEAVRLQPARLPRLARLIGAVPLRRVVHSVPREQLDRLRAAVLEDLEETHE